MNPYRFWPTSRILSVGDSLTAQAGDANYQLRLLVKLQRYADAKIAFYFVGSQNGPAPIYHEGHAGFRIDQLDAAFAGYYSANPADIVLIMAGINDIIADASSSTCVTRMNGLLTTVFTANPTVQVVVAKPPPMATTYPSYSAPRAAELVSFCAALPGVIDGFANRHISLVDCNTDFDPVNWTSDGIHQNATGALWIADRFLDDGYGRTVRILRTSERNP